MPAAYLEDNRPGAIAQLKLQESIAGLTLAKALPLPASGTPAQTAGNAVVQRARIWEDFTTFRGAAPPALNNIRTYMHKYEVAHMIGLVRQHAADPNMVNMLYATYQRLYAVAAVSAAPDWGPVATVLTSLVTNINLALAGRPHVPTGYEAADHANWADPEAAVTAAHAQVDGATAAVAPHSHVADARTISTINYSATGAAFPPTLVRLLRDIHGAWKSGQVMDQRTPAEQAAHTLTSDHPGALRSWHMNTDGTLPAAPAAAATPAHAAAMEAHYTATSGVMHALGAAPAGPVGFAEYTGTGILNDAHNSKIILDYKNGDVYLTLSHYQHWSNDHTGFHLRGNPPSALGTHSPWFKINMNA